MEQNELEKYRQRQIFKNNQFLHFFYWDTILLFVQCSSCYGYRRVLFWNSP